jgi:TonB family protein
MMPRSKLIGVLLFAQLVFGFQSTPAKLLSNPAPKYPEEAKAAGIQGTVVLDLIVDEHGAPTQIKVLSPLGYGLEESAMEAVSHWKYQPATLGGRPVKLVTRVTVNFSLTNLPVDGKAEKQHAEFNRAFGAVQAGKQDAATIDSLRNLTAQKYPPGMYLYGKVLEAGQSVTADPEQGFRLIQESADKKYGPALYEVATERLQGNRLEKDPVKGIELMQNAAKFGSKGAREFLGEAYEKGSGVPVDFDKSRQYFRLCAAGGDPACQARLGSSLLEHSDQPDRDFVQAIAWLQLASDSGNKDAAAMLESQGARATPAQLRSASQLKAQLVHAQ